METILIDEKEGIATVTLNRPHKLNAFTFQMLVRLLEAMERISAREDLRVVVLTGRGISFCAGADLAYLRQLQMENDVKSFRRLLKAGKDLFLLIRRMPQIVIASINGSACGSGCSLALAADWRIASEEASLGQIFLQVGLHPDMGAFWLLPRLVGPSAALELAILDTMIPSRKALDLGLVNRVTAAPELSAHTRQVARRIAEGPPLAIRNIKRGIHDSFHQPVEKVLELEIEGQLRCFLSEDSREGFEAVLQRRRGKFQGR